MFESIFDELFFHTDWKKLNEALKEVENCDYRNLYEKWENGKLTKKDDVEYKDGKLVKDEHIDNSKKIEAKKENDCDGGCQCNNKNDEIFKLRDKVSNMSVELDKTHQRIGELEKENKELKKKLEEIKNLF